MYFPPSLRIPLNNPILYQVPPLPCPEQQTTIKQQQHPTSRGKILWTQLLSRRTTMPGCPLRPHLALALEEEALPRPQEEQEQTRGPPPPPRPAGSPSPTPCPMPQDVVLLVSPQPTTGAPQLTLNLSHPRRTRPTSWGWTLSTPGRTSCQLFLSRCSYISLVCLYAAACTHGYLGCHPTHLFSLFSITGLCLSNLALLSLFLLLTAFSCPA